MIKKLFKKYGATVLFYSGIMAIFALGVIVGMFGRSAPNAETADFHGEKVTNKAASTVIEIKTQTTTEPAPKYYKITVTATAYCPCKQCCGKTDGITATGTIATAGRTIAVDPDVIPYGTEIIINGNTYVAEDCGGAVKGNDVDIFFDTHEEALNFGRQNLTAYVLN